MCVVQDRGLDKAARESIISSLPSFKEFIGESAILLSIRLLEVLHSEPDKWMPYKKLCLENTNKCIFSMTADDLKALLEQTPLNPESYAALEEQRVECHRDIKASMPALLKLADLLAPGADISSEDLIWAIAVTQMRAIKLFEGIPSKVEI